MKTISASNNLALEINLSIQSTKTFVINQKDRRKFIGGKGLGLKYIAERMPPGIDPLSAQNHILFLTGVLIGTGAPCSGRFSAVTKSPQTGLFSSSSCGGPFGTALKSCGYDVLIITGKSERPTILEISENKISFCDATDYWGLDTKETQEQLKPLQYDGCLAIGPAGENLVRYANISSGHRFLGRGGFGAVLGSKNLKAIVARGQRFKVVPIERDRFRTIHKEAIQKITSNEFTAYLYNNFGTASNLKPNNENNILPVNNFQETQSEFAEKLYADQYLKDFNTKPSACKSCPIRCGRKFAYADKDERQAPEYETLGLFGPNLGIYDINQITEWNHICNRMGMDTISAAVTLAYAIEAAQHKLLESDLEFGNAENIESHLIAIANRTGFGDELANGSQWLANKYGGKEFAAQVKGLELPAYDPRGSWGQGLAYAVANRGACHMSATMFPIEVYKKMLSPRTARAKAHFVVFFEDLYCVVNALQICVFTSYPFLLEDPIVKYLPAWLLKPVMTLFPRIATQVMDVHIFSELFSSITGIDLSPREIKTIGRRIHTLERYLNTREGISRKDDILPDRFFEGPIGINRNKFEKMLNQYYRIRQFNNNGLPVQSILDKLSLDE